MMRSLCSCKAASASLMYHYPPLLVCNGNKPCETRRKEHSTFKTDFPPPHCYDPTHSALVLNKEKQYNTVDFISRAEHCDSFLSLRLEELLQYATCSSFSLFHSQLNSLALLPCCQCGKECKLRWRYRRPLITSTDVMGGVQYSKTLLPFFSKCPPCLLQSYSYSLHPPSPLHCPFPPRGFSTPCHTWPPPAHYALFCVMLVDARAGRVWMISIHLRDPFAPPTVFTLFLSDRHIFCLSPLSPSILHLRQCWWM